MAENVEQSYEIFIFRLDYLNIYRRDYISENYIEPKNSLDFEKISIFQKFDVILVFMTRYWTYKTS